METPSPTSSSGEPPDRLEAWEIAVARGVARDFLAHRKPFRIMTFEDLVQECLAHWLGKRGRYSQERGASRATYMREVLGAKLLDSASSCSSSAGSLSAS